MNESGNAGPIRTTTTGSVPATALAGPWSRCDWLLDRYPRDFVGDLCAGARCDAISRAEILPLLDRWPWEWRTLVDAAHRLYVLGAPLDVPAMATALEQFADAGVAPQEYDPKEKEREAGRERGARRAERRMEQPWRKQHR
jgi:hypothetical protein